jgi:small conductance mechanosensitive channel
MNLTADDVHAFAHAYLLPLAFRVIVAFAIFIVGRELAKIVMRVVERAMARSGVDDSLRTFFGDLIYALLFVGVVLAALDALGIDTTAMLAVLGATGLAIGLAMQGSLSNAAAGVMLIMLRPYKVGDRVRLGDHVGRVERIRVLQTVIVTADHREVSIPNSRILAHPIENLSVLGRRRVDLVVTVGQTTDLGRVRKLLEDVVLADPRIEPSSAEHIALAEISDASVKLLLRPWTSVENYAKVASDIMERIKAAMEAEQLTYAVALHGVAS